MNNKAIEFPHPVLSEYSHDFNEGNFSIEVLSYSDSGDTIDININCHLDSECIEKYIDSNQAKAVIRIDCSRTSYRTIKDILVNSNNNISISKSQVAEKLYLQAIIVSTDEIKQYSSPDFNQNYFKGLFFNLRKGDVMAIESGITVKLDTILEENMSGIILVSESKEIDKIQISYPTVSETEPDLQDYIVIKLPEKEYACWAKLRSKKYLKHGIERFLQASLLLPALTEGVSRLRTELTYEEEDEKYEGTVWADSIIETLKSHNISDLSTCNLSDYQIANILLDDVVSDSLTNLMQKMNDWQTVIMEDDLL